MKQRLRIVDAFTDQPFSGNPAAVVVLDEVAPDAWMAVLAREMNLSETAFVVRDGAPDGGFGLRWFTPRVEVNLCGHATLAAAHCLFEDGLVGAAHFATRGGALTVNRASDGSLTMDFPAAPAAKIDDSQGLAAALGAPLLWAGRAHIDQLLAVVADETAVRSVAPDLVALAQFDVDGVIVTAVADAGSGYDFVSRMFAPRVGIPEDPVTGSSHTVLGPYWAGQLGKDSLVALQVSDRAGRVGVEVRGDRVLLTGRATTVLDGTVVGAAAR